MTNSTETINSPNSNNIYDTIIELDHCKEIYYSRGGISIQIQNQEIIEKINAYLQKNEQVIQKYRKGDGDELCIQADENDFSFIIDENKPKFAFVGGFNKGKTTIINMLTGIDLPVGNNISTRGISIKNMLSFNIIDTAVSFKSIHF